MSRWLLAGGGTAGHVNPLLATADALVADGDEVLVLGTAEGLESRLVPERGYELVTIPRVPFPRRIDRAAVAFPRGVAHAIRHTGTVLIDRQIDAVIGFGGYAAAPAYLAARRRRVPFALHEQNALPGLANRLGARFAGAVGVTFEGTPLPHATVTGMPLRNEIATLDRAAARHEALQFFDLHPDRPVLLVTGGSLGADRINRTIVDVAPRVLAAGWQILHLVGGRSTVSDPGLAGYRMLDYCFRMDLAFAAATFAVSRAGASTVAELAALGMPAVYVPYAVGNGEQRFNVRGVVAAGGGRVIQDATFTPAAFAATVLPLLADAYGIERMSAAAAAFGVRDGAARMTRLARTLLERGPRVS